MTLSRGRTDQPVKVTIARAHQQTAEEALRRAVATHDEPCEVVVICTAPGTSALLEQLVRDAIGMVQP